MKNIVNFIVKHHIVLLFIFLEALSLTLLFRHSYYQKTAVINSSNYISGKIYTSYSSVKQYINLKEENERLANQNAWLLSFAPQSYTLLKKVSVPVNDSVYKQKYRWFSAKVVNNSVNKRNNYLTLDKGSLLGVKNEMAVVSVQGVVGIVKDVSPHFASVMSVLHKNCRISAQLKKGNYFGSLTWDGNDYRYAQLSDIPKHVEIKKGDTVITSYYSSIFPQGIMIGTIEEFTKTASDNFYQIKVKLSTNYKNLTNVYVIENLFKAEQDSLELRSQQTDDK
jgi:rod shape-determining protein MreC